MNTKNVWKDRDFTNGRVLKSEYIIDSPDQEHVPLGSVKLWTDDAGVIEYKGITPYGESVPCSLEEARAWVEENVVKKATEEIPKEPKTPKAHKEPKTPKE